MPRRWIRLDVSWEDSSWLDALSGAAAGCWPRLLCTVKRDGAGGRCKRMPPAVAARRWRVTPIDVEELERAAVADDALLIENGEWVIVNWAEYQEPDHTAAERQRRFRADRSRLSDTPQNRASESPAEIKPVTDVTPLQPLHPVTNGVTRRVTETETYDNDRENKTEKENSAIAEKKKKRGFQIRDDWRPNSDHRDLATKLKLDIALEYDRFRDHAVSVGRVCRDWDAAFRNWLRKAAEFTRRGTIPNGSEASRIKNEYPGKGRHNGSGDLTRAVANRQVSENGTHYWNEEQERWMPL